MYSNPTLLSGCGGKRIDLGGDGAPPSFFFLLLLFLLQESRTSRSSHSSSSSRHRQHRLATGYSPFSPLSVGLGLGVGNPSGLLLQRKEGGGGGEPTLGQRRKLQRGEREMHKCCTHTVVRRTVRTVPTLWREKGR